MIPEVIWGHLSVPPEKTSGYPILSFFSSGCERLRGHKNLMLWLHWLKGFNDEPFAVPPRGTHILPKPCCLFLFFLLLQGFLSSQEGEAGTLSLQTDGLTTGCSLLGIQAGSGLPPSPCQSACWVVGWFLAFLERKSIDLKGRLARAGGLGSLQLKFCEQSLAVSVIALEPTSCSACSGHLHTTQL